MCFTYLTFAPFFDVIVVVVHSPPPPCDAPLLNNPCLPRSTLASSSRNVTDSQMPSLYQFSAIDVASAVDYSHDLGINDNVVNNPPPRLVTRTYTVLPSPLSKEKWHQKQRHGCEEK